MLQLILYSKATGEIAAYKDPIESDAIDTPEIGSLIADVDPTATNFYVKNGEVKSRPERPSRNHRWNGSSWTLDIEAANARARQTRSRLLSATDWTDTVSAQSRMSPEEFDAWQTYRQALRDVTAQPGFPLSVTWPVAPNGED